MEIKQYQSDLLQSNMYLISENGHTIVIDPSRDLREEDNLKVDMLIVTHEHYDHISGVNQWKEKYGAKLLCSEPCAQNLKSSRKNLSRFFDVFCEMQTWIRLEKMPEADLDYSCQADDTFHDQMTFQWQGHEICLMEIPGHSKGSIGILLDGKEFFSGDSLMENQEIELRFPGGSAKSWEAVGKPRIAAIDRGIRVWPGHFDCFVL